MFEVIVSRDNLNHLHQSVPSANLRGYYVHPAPELLRDDTFLEEVAALAKTHNRPIYFEGSVLGHAYYVMARAGATVVPVNAEEPNDAGKYYNKLVRDKIPLTISRAGGLMRVRHVSQSEAHGLLRQKLIEEAFEVRNCTDRELVEELADVLEVVESLRKHNGISVEELNRVRQEKRNKRGGFDEAVYLESTGVQSLRLPPLFEIEDTLPHARSQPQPHPQVTEEPLDGRTCLARLSISLIPPVAGTEHPAVILLDPLDAFIEVRYANARAIVSISRMIRQDNALQDPLQDPFLAVTETAPTQLLLFPDAEEGEPS